MRIDKVEIDGFGKLNNQEFTFADGVNLIYGENESGKSTLCEFILSAFYGLPNESKKVSDDITPRRKYRPWSGDVFGGRVYFTDDSGRRLVIERSFKGTKRGDKAILRDADTWEELDNSDDIGERLFGLSREAFLKTLYVKSFGADNLKSDDGEILSRLSNMETSGAEDVSYSKIINAMEKEIFSLKTKTGRGGKISALQDRETSLRQELSLSKMTYSALARDEEMVQSLKSQAEQKEKEAAELEKKYELAVMHEKYLQKKKIDETKEVIEKRLVSAKEKLAQKEELLKNLDQNQEISVSADEISRARALETKRLLAEEKMLEAKREVPEGVRPILDETRLIPGFFGFVILLIGFLLRSYIMYISGVLVAVVGILICLLINIKKRKDDDKKREVYYELKHNVDKINDELNSIFEPYGVKTSDELSALFMNTKSIEEKEAELKMEYNECKAEIEMLEKSIPESSDTEEFSKEAIEYSEEPSDIIYAQVNQLKAEIRQLSQNASELDLRIAKETAEIRKETDILSELEGVTEEITVLEKRYESLITATRWLTQAHEEIKNNFAPKLNEKTSQYLSLLTHDKYKDVRANDSFSLNLKSTGGEIVEAGFMSRGTYDLLYIALRFAAMNVITDGKIPPVILDDAFSQLDDARLLAAVELINNTPEFSQVMLFTCHENYKELVRNKNINVVSL